MSKAARPPPAPPAPAPIKPLKLAIGVLKPDPANARTIEAPALRGLGVSMETFGDLSGIVWNEQSGSLVSGHQRMNRLRAAGAAEWVRLSKTHGEITHPKTGELFTIRIVDWDPVTERMANLTANNPEIQGDFTDDAAAQLRELEEHAAFDDLMLGELQALVDKEVRKLQRDQEADDAAAGAGGFAGKYMVVVECSDEGKQAELLERLAAEGFKVKALLQ